MANSSLKAAVWESIERQIEVRRAGRGHATGRLLEAIVVYTLSSQIP
jgi:hypothetical protein